jgi:hypothetical protein
MRLRRTPAVALAAVAVAMLGVASAGAAPAATPVPTSVLLFSGSYGGSTYTGLVAAQKTASGKGRLVGLVKGLKGGTAEASIVANADCAQPLGHELVKGTVTNKRPFDVRGNMSGSIGGRSLALVFADRKQFVCYRLPAPRPSGAAFVLTGGSGGVVTMQRRPAAVGLVALTVSSQSRLSEQPSTASCGGATAALGKPLKMVAKEAFFYGDVFVPDFPTYRQARSLVFTGSSGKVGCITWGPSAYGTLLS